MRLASTQGTGEKVGELTRDGGLTIPVSPQKQFASQMPCRERDLGSFALLLIGAGQFCAHLWLLRIERS